MVKDGIAGKNGKCGCRKQFSFHAFGFPPCVEASLLVRYLTFKDSVEGHGRLQVLFKLSLFLHITDSLDDRLYFGKCHHLLPDL